MLVKLTQRSIKTPLIRARSVSGVPEISHPGYSFQRSHTTDAAPSTRQTGHLISHEAACKSLGVLWARMQMLLFHGKIYAGRTHLDTFEEKQLEKQGV